MAKRKLAYGLKSAFIRQVLARKPKITAVDMTALWKAAGHPGSISRVHIHHAKHRITRLLGRKGQRAERRRIVRRVARTGGQSGYAQLEQALDGLVAQAEQLNDANLADALRSARRRASAKLLA